MNRLYAVIDPDSDRYGGWIREHSRDFVPVVSADPVPFDFDCDGRSIPCYRVDLGALDPAILESIIACTAAANGAGIAEVRESFDREGMMISAAEVLVGTDPAAVRLRFPFWGGAG